MSTFSTTGVCPNLSTTLSMLWFPSELWSTVSPRRSVYVLAHTSIPVGIEFMGGWFKKMAWAMKEENSFKVFTMTTVPDSRWEQYAGYVAHLVSSFFLTPRFAARWTSFANTYTRESETGRIRALTLHRRGGQLSSLRTLIDHMADAGLNLETVENIGPRTYNHHIYL
jgi:hypothetical protein